MSKQLISKHGIRSILGFAVILLLASACRQEKGISLNMNKPLPPVTLEAALQPGEATLGDRVTYTLSLSRIPEITAELPDLTPSVDGLTRIDSGRSGPDRSGGRIAEKRWITYRADRIGTVVFPSVKMTYQRNGAAEEMQTQEITLQVKSVLSPEMKDIHGIKPLEKPERDLHLFFYAAALAAILVLLTLGAWLYWRKRKKRPAAPPPLPPHLEAEQSLRKLEAMGLLHKGEFKKHYFLLSEIFRRYLERRFAFPAAERTTEEILGGIDAFPVENPLRDELRSFLRNTDPVKFAGAACSMDQAGGETERVRRFVRETAEQEPVKAEENKHVAV